MECSICTSKIHGVFTSPCGHTFCGKCFLRLHVDACLELGMTHDPRKKSKCPFCRQVLGFEEEDYYKIRNAVQIQDDLNSKSFRLRLHLRETTKQLQTTTRWLSSMRRLKEKLRIEMLQ